MARRFGKMRIGCFEFATVLASTPYLASPVSHDTSATQPADSPEFRADAGQLGHDTILASSLAAATILFYLGMAQVYDHASVRFDTRTPKPFAF